MAVAIVTDSAAALPPDLAEKADVRVVPMQLIVGGATYRDGELSLQEVMSRLDEGVSTSGPSPGEFAAAIEPLLGGDGVLVLTIAGTMSSTHGSARVAAELLAKDPETNDRVRVVDTGTAAGAQGLAVVAAAAAADAGGTLDEVEAAARRVCDRVRLVATLPSLDALAKSGRVPGAAAWAGRWLGLNPVFEFRGGRARPLRPARSRASALDRIVATWRSSRPQSRAPHDLHVAALHALAPETAEELLDAVQRDVEPASLFIGAFSPVMVCHTGPGLAGLAWWWEPLPEE